MEKQNKMQLRRKVLSSICRKLEILRDVKVSEARTDNERLYWETRTKNQLLMKLLYNKDDSKIFKTFNQWKAENKTILKGAKSVMVWAQPLGELKAQKAKEHGQEAETSEDEMRYFPICFLFDNTQVLERV